MPLDETIAAGDGVVTRTTWSAIFSSAPSMTGSQEAWVNEDELVRYRRTGQRCGPGIVESDIRR